ncbi:MAG: TRAP transporter small permease [Betaproteobacteria bacterium]|nr:TRAP transporter small permease [Betaproteobacteria bacterium]
MADENLWRRSGRFLEGLETVTMVFNMVVVFAMMAVVVFGVVMRYVFNSPVSMVAELTEFMMVSLTFLTIAYIQHARRHVAVSFLVTRQSQRTQWLLGLVITGIGLVAFVLITWAGWRFAYQAWEFDFHSEEADFPLFPARLLVPAGSLLMCLRLIGDLVRGIRSKAMLGPSEEIALETDEIAVEKEH